MNQFRTLIWSAFFLALSGLGAPSFAQRIQAFQFNGANGSTPSSDLIADPAGNLYGTTQRGGTCNAQDDGCGTVFEFSPPSAPGGQWTQTTIYTFQGAPDGKFPNGGLALDKAGNLFGTTQFGGTEGLPQGVGTVFELSPPARAGGAWTETILYNFGYGSLDGNTPLAPVIFDSSGNLYGTTPVGGAGPFGAGTVFELSPPSQRGRAWTQMVLYVFGTTEGDVSEPETPVVFDSAGNLYGTSISGGTGSCFDGCGTVFELSPSGGSWTETVLHSFGTVPNDGAQPVAALAVTPSGALLGTTQGGGLNNHGVVFALAPPPSPGEPWGYGLPYLFTGGADGGRPESRLTLMLGKPPVLFGTTANGGLFSEGTVYQLTPTSSPGGNWSETVLYNFLGANDGARPEAGVLLHGVALYGTASQGGIPGFGTAFRLSH